MQQIEGWTFEVYLQKESFQSLQMSWKAQTWEAEVDRRAVCCSTRQLRQTSHCRWLQVQRLRKLTPKGTEGRQHLTAPEGGALNKLFLAAVLRRPQLHSLYWRCVRIYYLFDHSFSPFRRPDIYWLLSSVTGSLTMWFL